MNEILYCQKETSLEEIEVFIKRAIIKHNRKHYFIGVHYLPTEVQLKFIDLLNEYLKSEAKRAKFNSNRGDGERVDSEDKYQYYSILKVIKEHRDHYLFIDSF
ncbi:hypothetical protein GHT06_007490 [Daphnia sinensis]|uniref:Uncharacterized protein n=1 Tax=Daphnia sinensis TaxID=1820382 RepID=A0AAD5PN07_9CRUS|nr:hypothetical protein GHT06_007490 [Daphnia sinensis]